MSWDSHSQDDERELLESARAALRGGEALTDKQALRLAVEGLREVGRLVIPDSQPRLAAETMKFIAADFLSGVEGHRHGEDR
jgi:hypothetical protein